MKQRKGYTIQYLHNIPYLLPYGQNIAEYKHSIRLNDSGTFLWKAMENDISRDDLLSLYKHHYSSIMPEADIPDSDVDRFIHCIDDLGMLEHGINTTPVTSEYKTMAIGPVNIRLYGNKKLYPKEFCSFFIDNSGTDKPDCDMYIDIVPDMPSHKGIGTILINNRELTIVDCNEIIEVLYPANIVINTMHITKDGSYVKIYAPKPIDDAIPTEVYHAVRLAFLYMASMHNMYAIHSSSVLYNGKALLFSGHSGMGKSTQTRLWNTLAGTPYINGDLNLISFDSDIPVVYGIPWCGTSGIYTEKKYQLGGIVLLGRSPHNTIQPLTADEKQLRISQRIISPAWTLEQLTANLDFAGKITDTTPIFHYLCNIEDDAVYTLKNHIDNYSQSDTT